MDNSPLKKLAPELRNKIYELVLLKKPLDSQDSRIVIDFDSNTASLDVAPNALALLGTCKQIQSEANKIFYSNHTFKIDTDGYSRFYGNLTEDDILRVFLGRLRPESRVALKHIEIRSYSSFEYLQMNRFHHIASHLKLDSFVCTFDEYCSYTKDGPIDILNIEKSRLELLERARAALPNAVGFYNKRDLETKMAMFQEPKCPCHCQMLKTSDSFEQKDRVLEAARWPPWPTNPLWWVTCRASWYGGNECARYMRGSSE